MQQRSRGEESGCGRYGSKIGCVGTVRGRGRKNTPRLPNRRSSIKPRASKKQQYLRKQTEGLIA